jgi:adenosine deaminase
MPRMKSGITREFIRRIPKPDLHVHLDGSLRIQTLIEFARRQKLRLPSYTEEGLRQKVFKRRYSGLPEYLRGFAYTCAALQTPENIERAAFELAEDNIAEGVRYVEVRFAPQLHAHDRVTVEDVFRAVARGMDRAKKSFNATRAVRAGRDLPFEYGLIACAMRSFDEHMGAYFSRLIALLPQAPQKDVFAIASLEVARAAVACRDRHGLPIVAFDLAGEEAGYPAGYHTEAYQYAHSHFLKKTVHAGEAYGPESIFQAITDCHANRVGHGTFLFSEDMIRAPSIADTSRYVEQLAEYIASQRITMEVCLTSNLQTTPSIPGVAEHPVRQMLQHNLSVSLGTDNRLVSHTTVTDELALLAAELPVTRHQFRNVVIAGFKGSFFPADYCRKREYVRQVIDTYDRLEAELLGPEAGRTGRRPAAPCGGTGRGSRGGS